MKNLEPVNVIVGRFQPFTVGHIKGAEQVYNDIHNRKSPLRTVFLIVDTPESKTDSRHPFVSEQIIKDNSVCKEPWFAGMYPIKNADIGKIASICRDNGFEPVMWTCGTDRYSQYSKQASPKYIDMYNLSSDFKINEIARTDEDVSASAVRKALKEDDRKTFEKMMPKWVWNKYDDYKSIVSSVKENLSLVDYIKESIYGNLGIDDSITNDATKQWIKIYNKQDAVRSCMKYAKIKNHKVLLPDAIKIEDPALLDNGHLPDYIVFELANPSKKTTIYIETSKITTLKNFPMHPNGYSIAIFKDCNIVDWSVCGKKINLKIFRVAIP